MLPLFVNAQVVFASTTTTDAMIEFAGDIVWSPEVHRTKFSCEPDFMSQVKALLLSHAVLRTAFWGAQAANGQKSPGGAESSQHPGLYAGATSTTKAESCCLALLSHLRKRKRFLTGVQRHALLFRRRHLL